MIVWLAVAASASGDLREDPGYRTGLALGRAGLGVGVAGHVVGLVGAGLTLGAAEIHGGEVSYDADGLAAARRVNAAGSAIYAIGGPMMGFGALSAQRARAARGEAVSRALPRLSIGLGLGGAALAAGAIALNFGGVGAEASLSPGAVVGGAASVLLAGSYVTGTWSLVESANAGSVTRRPIEEARLQLEIVPVASAGAAGIAVGGAW